MTAIVWGDPIKVDGKRPGWFGEYTGGLGYQRDDGQWFGPEDADALYWTEKDIVRNPGGWNTVSAIRLPSDHPHYLATNLPADWAISQALDRTKNAEGRPQCMWTLAGVKTERFHKMAWAVSIVELARMIEKYEPHLAPVDPDVLAVREILGAYNEAEDRTRDAEDYRNGTYDKDGTMVAALVAYRKVVAFRG